jgi:hypothetical protein
MVGNKEASVVRDLVIVAVDATARVRGISVQSDGRDIYGDVFAPGVHLVQPSVEIRFLMPDDPQISSVVFFKPTPREEGGRRLVRMGAIDLHAMETTGAVK